LRIAKAVPGEKGAVDIRLIRLGHCEHRALGDIVPLADSIRDAGLRHPVVIGPGYGLITGRRRLAACEYLGWKEVPYEAIGTVPEALAVFAREDADPRQALTMTVAERIYRDWQMRDELKWWPRAGQNKGVRGVAGDHRHELARGAGLNATQYTRAYEVVLAASGFRRAMNYLHPLDDEDKVAVAREAAKLLETANLRAVEPAYARYRLAISPAKQAPPAAGPEVDAALARLAGMAAGISGMALAPDAAPAQIRQWDEAITVSVQKLIRWRRSLRSTKGT
jgi:hypothetical protein